MFHNLDHIAIVVRDTEEALKFYRDVLGLQVLLSEGFDSTGVRLTHLDLGNTELQLVQPLSSDHALGSFLDQNGEGLHHICLTVDDVEECAHQLPSMGMRTRQREPHPAPRGRKALFIDPSTTRGVLWELTSPACGK